jgi:hypothetical protein
VRQFFRATFARVRPTEIAALEGLLSPAQVDLFRQMARSDQRHSLDVFYTLRQAGQNEHDLLQAALLHDTGKSVLVSSEPMQTRLPWQRITVWHRTLIVLMQRLAPDWLARLASDGRGWKRPFAIHTRHAEASAEWAAQVGCTPEVVALIRRHHEPEADDRRLVHLRWADELN